jgi:hypothetical protein
MVSFGNSLRIFRFPPSLIQPVLYIVHVHWHQWYLGLQWKSTYSPTFSIFTIKKKRSPFVVKLNQFTIKCKSFFDSHYQMHIRLTHNRSRRFHISVETTFSYQCGNKFIIRAHFSTYIYTYIWYTHTEYVNTTGFVHSACTSASVVSGATRLHSM